MNKSAPVGELDAGTIKREAGEGDAACTFASYKRRATCKLQDCCTAHTDKLAAVRQSQCAGAIGARRQRQRHLRAGGRIDGALEHFRLIVGTVWPHAVLRGVASERRCKGSRARRLRRSRQRTCCRTGGGGVDEAAAADIHAVLDLTASRKRCRSGSSETHSKT